jgi:hypothetical protein
MRVAAEPCKRQPGALAGRRGSGPASSTLAPPVTAAKQARQQSPPEPTVDDAAMPEVGDYVRSHFARNRFRRTALLRWSVDAIGGGCP